MLSPVSAPACLLRATDAASLKPTFEQKLSSAWDRPVAISDFFVPRVVAREGCRLLVQYRFSALGRSWTFWGQVGFDTDRCSGDSFRVPELQLVVPIFPFDTDLPALARFFSSSESACLLAGLREPLELTAAARLGEVQVLGYRLGRRAVLRCGLADVGPERAVVAKLIAPRKAARLARLMRELARRGFEGVGGDAIRVPRVLAESKDGILWLEEHEGPSLHDLVGAPAFVAACRGAARALRRLHALDRLDLPEWSVETELLRLREIVNATSELLPELATRLCEATRLAFASTPGAASSAATLHRDFYDKQLLTGADGMTLLDVDTLTVGDPALDVGNFLAHLVLRSHQDPGSAAVVTEARGAFLAGYGEVSEARCRFWEAASLLRLSCIYALRPRWRALAVPLLEESGKRLRFRGGSHA